MEGRHSEDHGPLDHPSPHVLIGLLLLRGKPTSWGCPPLSPQPLLFLGNILQIDRKDLLKSLHAVRKRGGRVGKQVVCGWEKFMDSKAVGNQTVEGTLQVSLGIIFI